MKLEFLFRAARRFVTTDYGILFRNFGEVADIAVSHYYGNERKHPFRKFHFILDIIFCYFAYGADYDDYRDYRFYIKKERQFEVDFIVCEKNKAIELIQVAHHIGDPASKLYKREVGGLVKGSKYAKCSKLTLIVMEGERQTINEGGRTIEIIPASEWLCNGKNIHG